MRRRDKVEREGEKEEGGCEGVRRRDKIEREGEKEGAREGGREGGGGVK